MSACGSSKTDSSVGQPDGVFTSSVIENRDGGTVSCKADDGAEILLVIPPNALPASVDVKLSVETDTDSETLYRVTIYPVELQLFEAAKLVISASGASATISGAILFSAKADIAPVPLKQSQANNVAEGCLYSFGSFTCARFDMTDYRDISSGIRNAKTQETWQDLLTAFNGIVWLGNYFYKNDELDETLTCFETIPALCGDALDYFMDKAVPEEADAIIEHKKALAKYKYIQKLCSDQEVLLKNLDDE